jgi:hypothetical protein
MLGAWCVFGRKEKDSTYSIGCESLRVHSMRRAGIPAIFELAAGERARESWAEIDTGVLSGGGVEMEVEGEGTRWRWKGRSRGCVCTDTVCNNGMEESWEGAGGEGVLSLARSMDGSGQVNSSTTALSLAVGGEMAARRPAW